MQDNDCISGADSKDYVTADNSVIISVVVIMIISVIVMIMTAYNDDNEPVLSVQEKQIPENKFCRGMYILVGVVTVCNYT